MRFARVVSSLPEENPLNFIHSVSALQALWPFHFQCIDFLRADIASDHG